MTEIEIRPFCTVEPDELEQMIAKITLRLQVGGYYFNRKGEIRQIVSFTEDEDYGEYQYIDNRSYTYTKHGIYDIHDFFCGDDPDQLIMPVSMSHFVNRQHYEEAISKVVIVDEEE